MKDPERCVEKEEQGETVDALSMRQDPLLHQYMLQAYLKGFEHARGGEDFAPITERAAMTKFNTWYEIHFSEVVL